MQKKKSGIKNVWKLCPLRGKIGSSRIVSYERKGCDVFSEKYDWMLVARSLCIENHQKNLVMTEGDEIIDSFVKLGLDA